MHHHSFLLNNKLSFSILAIFYVVSSAYSQRYNIEPIPFYKVNLTDNFWRPRIETVNQHTIPAVMNKNKETFRVKNFEVAAGKVEGLVCTVYPFDDSDVYKTIEGIAYALRIKRNPKLEAQCDSLIQTIKAAQEPDGYLYTWRTIAERNGKKGTSSESTQPNLKWLEGPRWQKEDELSHELYNVGHLYEAAVAYYESTGKKTLLDVALKNAELVAKDFGPDKLIKAPGHQEIEIGLVKLYKLTGDKKWLNLAKFFLDVRGYGKEYSQNHQKLQDQRVAVGHAVRLGYMFMAAADVAAYTGTHEYDATMTAVWNDITNSQMYLTGGVGATGSNEGFGGSYDLPNYSAYNETCSSISFAHWSKRMFQLTRDSRYLDVMERTIYNALNAGMSLSGTHYFYPNPLESRKNTARTDWFGCACCPPNLIRFFTFLPEFFYGTDGNDVYINMFAASNTTVEHVGPQNKKTNITIKQETNYPWDGKIKVKVQPASSVTFALKIRIPGWAHGEATPNDLYSFINSNTKPIKFYVNGKEEKVSVEKGFAVINRKWKKNDVVTFELPMEIQKTVAHSKVNANENRIALQRGPFVYCLEGKDQADDRILHLMVPDSTKFTTTFEPNMLGGVQTVSFRGFMVKSKTSNEKAELSPVQLKAIPYFSWANRGKDNMLVWLPKNLKSAYAASAPNLISTAKATASDGVKGNLQGVTDQMPIKNSGDEESSFIHWWPKFGTTEWVQFDFSKEEEVGTAKVYFFDDEKRGGGCRIPESFKVQFLDNGKWRSVYAPNGYTAIKDNWTEVEFEPVKTTAIRIEMVFKKEASGGMLEIDVY